MPRQPENAAKRTSQVFTGKLLTAYQTRRHSTCLEMQQKIKKTAIKRLPMMCF
ncbi:FaeA/PapI family transcriptional regulator [Saezia sanguinis]|uniref:FaeA/PapI family transcriptional regulator n=1 Tax=Saezia sanguinis TaxID=1965230 RepID=UPI0034E00557